MFLVDCGWTARSLFVISWTVRDLEVSGSVLLKNMAFGNKVAKSINLPEIIFSFVLGVLVVVTYMGVLQVIQYS